MRSGLCAKITGAGEWLGGDGREEREQDIGEEQDGREQNNQSERSRFRQLFVDF